MRFCRAHRWEHYSLAASCRILDGRVAYGCDRSGGTHPGIAKGTACRAEEASAILGRALIPMTLPVVLLGGLFSGIFTPTEAAAVAAIYAIGLGALVYRNLGPRTLTAVLLNPPVNPLS